MAEQTDSSGPLFGWLGRTRRNSQVRGSLDGFYGGDPGFSLQGANPGRPPYDLRPRIALTVHGGIDFSQF